MKVEVRIDARKPNHGLDSVKGLWVRFIEGRRIINTFHSRMRQPCYRGELADAYDKLMALHDADLAHIKTLVALLGNVLARKVCGVSGQSPVWEKLFPAETKPTAPQPVCEVEPPETSTVVCLALSIVPQI